MRRSVMRRSVTHRHAMVVLSDGFVYTIELAITPW
jgi:hypothetical protein